VKKLFVALCILTVSMFGILGCSPKTDDGAGGGAGTTETTDEAPAEGAAE